MLCEYLLQWLRTPEIDGWMWGRHGELFSSIRLSQRTLKVLKDKCKSTLFAANKKTGAKNLWLQKNNFCFVLGQLPENNA